MSRFMLSRANSPCGSQEISKIVQLVAKWAVSQRERLRSARRHRAIRCVEKQKYSYCGIYAYLRTADDLKPRDIVAQRLDHGRKARWRHGR